MKLINLDHYSELRSELNEFVTLCNSYNYRPTKSDFDEITKFILLYHSGGATMCESVDENMINKLYESFPLNELVDDANWEGDWDTSVSTIKSLASNVAKASLAAVTIGAVSAGMFIQYLFKKSKVNKAVDKEKKVILDRIKRYQKLYDLKVKKWKLQGEKGEVPIMELPPIK